MTLTMCPPHFTFSLCELTFAFNFVPVAACFKSKLLSVEQGKTGRAPSISHFRQDVKSSLSVHWNTFLYTLIASSTPDYFSNLSLSCSSWRTGPAWSFAACSVGSEEKSRMWLNHSLHYLLKLWNEPTYLFYPGGKSACQLWNETGFSFAVVILAKDRWMYFVHWLKHTVTISKIL